MAMPADQLRRMLEQTLIPPTQVVELDPDTIESTTIRFGTVGGTLAESYQLNSCLTATSFARLGDREDITTVTDFYLTTAADGYDELVDQGAHWARPLATTPAWVQRLVGPLAANPAVAATLFNADLLVAFDGGLWRLVPDRPGLQFEGTWTDELTAQVHAAVPSQADGPPPEGLVLLVAHLTRASYVCGDRSFRAAAISCGVLLGLLWAVLGSQPPFARFRATQQFLDHPVNRAARCDGVERGVQVVAFVNPVPPAQTPPGPTAPGPTPPGQTPQSPTEEEARP